MTTEYFSSNWIFGEQELTMAYQTLIYHVLKYKCMNVNPEKENPFLIRIDNRIQQNPNCCTYMADNHEMGNPVVLHGISLTLFIFSEIHSNCHKTEILLSLWINIVILMFHNHLRRDHIWDFLCAFTLWLPSQAWLLDMGWWVFSTITKQFAATSFLLDCYRLHGSWVSQWFIHRWSSTSY